MIGEKLTLNMHYDLIGDIHGHSKPLTEPLTKLGYRMTDGVYRHPDRQVIFLGDFIDRGPQQREVIDIVRPRIDPCLASHTRSLL